MSEPSEAAFEEAERRFHAEGEINPTVTWVQWRNAFSRFIQEVSDAVKAARSEQVPGAPLTNAIMRHIEPLILPEPVDPLLIEAREIAARDAADFHAGVSDDFGHVFFQADAARMIRAGNADTTKAVQGRLAALKRGIEIGSVQP